MKVKASIHISILLAVGGLLWFLGYAILPIVFWCLAGVLVVLAIVSPPTLKTILDLGTRFGKIVGHAVAVTLLTLIFYTVFVCVAVWLRICGKDAMAREFPGSEKSFWVLRKGHPPDIQSYLKPYSQPHFDANEGVDRG